MRYRGLLEQFDAASSGSSHPAPVFPFGDLQIDFPSLPDPPLRGLRLPQPRLERLLAELACEPHRMGCSHRRASRDVVAAALREALVH